ncbi:MAG: DUF452 family protein [Muribaculaceae bacterium]|nr:DUF452 family protein [Muribaculaceae bacterium]
MKHAFIQNQSSPRLIVIFAGWGMDATPFGGLSKPGYDIMVVWDYRVLDFNAEWTAPYSEVCVLAWSMGVQTAQLCHKVMGPKVTARIAVGGTVSPVSDSDGIPTDIFQATLDGLTEAALHRFYRRMCGGAAAFRTWAEKMPQRGIDELRDELEAIGARTASPAPRFDHYLLTAADAIFPPENQRHAFRGCDITEVNSPHLPDFQGILDEYFIDKPLVGERFGAAAESYENNAEAQGLIARRLASMLDDKDSRAILRRPDAHILEVGCGTGILTRRLAEMSDGAAFALWDILELPGFVLPANATYTCTDAETAIQDVPEASFDLIASASTIQWFNSPERFVSHCLRALRPGGMLALATFGRDNLPEIRRACGTGLHLCDAETWRTALEAMPDAEIVELTSCVMQSRFDSPMELLRHLSLTGVNAVTRSGNARAAAAALTPDADGRYTLSYQPIFILIRKK